MLSPGDDTPLPFAFPPPPTFQVTIDDWNLIFYSMIYTAVPCMTYGVFEQVVLPRPPMLTQLNLRSRPSAPLRVLHVVLPLRPARSPRSQPTSTHPLSPHVLMPVFLLLLLGCALEQPAPPEMLLRHPAAYRGGPACASYNGRSFLLAMADTVWQVSAICPATLELQPEPDGRACVASHGPWYLACASPCILVCASPGVRITAGGRDLLRPRARLRAVPRRRAA